MRVLINQLETTVRATPADIRVALDAIDPQRDGVVSLERSRGSFMEAAGNRDEGYIMQVIENEATTFVSHTPPLDQPSVIRVMNAYLADDPAWRTLITWEDGGRRRGGARTIQRSGSRKVWVALVVLMVIVAFIPLMRLTRTAFDMLMFPGLCAQEGKEFAFYAHGTTTLSGALGMGTVEGDVPTCWYTDESSRRLESLVDREMAQNADTISSAGEILIPLVLLIAAAWLILHNTAPRKKAD